jgi:Zn-finger nucleic acid-binding protein
MTDRQRAGATFSQCPTCSGVFLRASDRGLLTELENDWHLSSGPTTQPIPRITSDMSAPAMGAPAPSARSFVDELFG